MTVSLENLRREMSRQMGDFWNSSLTSNGNAGGTTLVDTELQRKADDWIDDSQMEMYDIITSGTQDEEERKISSLSTSTLTVLAHGAQIDSGVAYEIHRLFSPSDKRIALVWAARNSYPWLYNRIRDENKTYGDWLRNGGLENWASASTPDSWTTITVTAAQNTTSPFYTRGGSSMKLTTAAGNVTQQITDFDDLKYLAGQSVTFRVEGHCDTASCLRIRITDGTNTQTSDYHSGNSAWKEEPLEVTLTIVAEPTSIQFIILHDVAAGTSYVDDARVLSIDREKIYIGDLAFPDRKPTIVEQAHDANIHRERWTVLRNWWVDSDDYLHLPEGTMNDRLRITGKGYLDFLVAGASSTAWTSTVNVNSPQTDIIVALAIQHIYETVSPTNYSAGDAAAYQAEADRWKGKLAEYISRFAMESPPVTVQSGRSRVASRGLSGGTLG